PGAKDKVAYTIAVITVTDAPLAPKGTKTVRLGFIPPPPMVAIRPAPFLPAVGMEGCFFLNRQPGGADFYVAGVLAFVDKNSPNFEKDVALVNRSAKVLADPNAALKAKDADDRFLAAAMLIARYSRRHSPNDKPEPIDADQSKMILQALAAA